MATPSDSPIVEDSALELDLLWARHRGTILAITGVIVVAALGAGGWFLSARQSRAQAGALFATASGPDAWREVIAKFPGSMPAANAAFLLAESQRETGDLDGSTATYRMIIEKFPNHPLIGGASLGIASNLAAAGKTAETLAALREVQARHSSSYAAPFAAVIEGRMLAIDSQFTEARRVLQAVLTNYPNSPATRVAGAQLDELSLIAPPEPKSDGLQIVGGGLIPSVNPPPAPSPAQ